MVLVEPANLQTKSLPPHLPCNVYVPKLFFFAQIEETAAVGGIAAMFQFLPAIRRVCLSFYVYI